MTGFLDDTLNASQQIQAIYIAYFGRAADGGGDVYWLNEFLAEKNTGLSTTQVVTNISESFSVQAEAQALYAFLAAPPSIPIPDPANPPPTIAASIDVFLNAVYQDLFNRGVDAGGEAYWSKQILSGAVSVGAAVYDIADGAAAGSVDAQTLLNKIAAAGIWTTQTTANNLGITPNNSGVYTPPVNQDIPYLTAATETVNLVTSNDSTVQTSAQYTHDWIFPLLPPSPPNDPVPFTTGIDTLVGKPGDDVFVAGVVGADGLKFGLQNTLNTGDEATGSTDGNNSVVATLTPLYVPVLGDCPTYLLNGWVPGEWESNNSPFGLTTYYDISTQSYFYGVNQIYNTNFTYTTYFVRPILNNIQTFEIVNTGHPQGFFDGYTVDLLQSTSVQTLLVQNSAFGDFTFLNVSSNNTGVPTGVTNVTLQGSADSAIFLFAGGGPGNPDPVNVPILVTSASIIDSNSGGIVFGFEDSYGTQYGLDVPTVALNVSNSPNAYFDIYGYSNDEPLGGPTTVNLNLLKTVATNLVPRPGSTTGNQAGHPIPLPGPLQTQVDPDNLWLYDHALTQDAFLKPILTTLNINATGHYEVYMPEYTCGSFGTDRNTFLDITTLTVVGSGSLDLTGDTFGASATLGGINTASNNQGDIGVGISTFQHFRNLVTVDASGYTGNLDLAIAWNDYGNATGAGKANNLTSIVLGNGDNHLSLLSEYSSHYGTLTVGGVTVPYNYTITLGSGNNVLLFGVDNLTTNIFISVKAGLTAGNNTLGLTNGDLLDSGATANVSGISTLEFVGAVRVDRPQSDYIGYNDLNGSFVNVGQGVNDYDLSALPGGSVTGNLFFKAVTLTAYSNYGFASSVPGSNSYGTTGKHNGGYFGAPTVYSGEKGPTIPSDAVQATGAFFDGTQDYTTDYVIGGNVLLFNAPTEIPLTITNYADDTDAHRLSTGLNGIAVAVAGTSFNPAILDLNFHNIDYKEDGQATSKFFWQYVELLQLDYTETENGGRPFYDSHYKGYQTVNIDAATTLAASGAKATAYVDEINHLHANGIVTLTVTGNATLWIDDLDQSNPLALLDAHTSTGNLGSNWMDGTGAGSLPTGVNSISTNDATVSSASNLGYLDVNHKFHDGPSITVETTQGLNFIQIEGHGHNGRADIFDLLGGNNQIWVDDNHISSSGQYDTFNFYNTGANLGVAATVDTVPHITAADKFGNVTIANADNLHGLSTDDAALHPNTGAATIYGFEADNNNNHNDVINLTGFNFPVAQQTILNVSLSPNVSDTTNLAFVAGMFDSGASQYGIAEYVVQGHGSSIQHPHDVFVFVDVNHDGNFQASTDMAIHLINYNSDITLSPTNFHFA